MRHYLKLQEEVMDFELKHLDIIQGETQIRNSQNDDKRIASSSHYQAPNYSSSSVLEELTEQIEDLQAKLKTSYRKLLLFETENQKLIQEKNAYFIDNKVLNEHNQVLRDQNKSLDADNDNLRDELDQKNHKIDIAEKLIAAQKVDLNRLSKFHLKVKNIIKPYVEDLKNKNSESLAKIDQQVQLIHQMQTYQNELELKIQQLEKHIETLSAQYSAEKNSLIQSYEEQIHFLSKEIVEQQQKTLDFQNENLKLKKQCETKHFVENELVRYKRMQDENIQTINSLKLKESESERKITEIEYTHSGLNSKISKLETENEIQKDLLEVTRKQLSQKISEIEELQLRLKMFEKLNSNLSLNLKDSQI